MKLTIPGRPRSKLRPRVTARGTWSPSADVEQAIRWQAHQAQPEAMTGPVALTVRFYLKTPGGRPDLVNLAAMIADALQGKKDKRGYSWPGAIQDDSQIVELHAYKLQGEPRTELEIKKVLPTPAEIRGMSPDFTGDLSSEEYLRQSRGQEP